MTGDHPALRRRLAGAARDLGAGRRRRAIETCRRVLETRPDEADALHVLGVCQHLEGQCREARRSLSRAVELCPDRGEYHNSLGNVLLRLGELAAAVDCFRHATEMEPALAQAWYNLGNALGGSRGREAVADLDAARAAYHRAAALDPDSLNVQRNLGVLHVRRGELDAAETCFRRVLADDAHDPGALNNLAALHLARGETERALDCFQRALRHHPEVLDARLNLAGHYRRNGRLAEAVEVYRDATAHHPDLQPLHLNLALTMLLAGRLDEGWEHYEWRWRNGGRPGKRSGCPQPVWRGEPLQGRTILLTAEQGFGDLIQFIRYAGPVRRRGGVVVAETRAPLARLFATCPWVDRVVDAASDEPRECHVQIPLLSLPRIFRTDLDSIPAEVPYLSAPEEVTPEVARRLGGRTSDLRVGVVWAGSPGNPSDARRSCPLEHLAPLAEVPGVRLYSLLYGERGRELEAHPELGIVDLGPHLGDFYETAAVVQRMDLVITVDTSMAHLAGALGAPVWTLLCAVPDWRWLLGRDDTPWYPAMRLFRQRRDGDWPELLARVAAALRGWRGGR